MKSAFAGHRGVSLSNCESAFFLVFALTACALVLIKVFLFEDCYAFDSNDDVNHTFVNLTAAIDAMKQGAVPGINLFNNFGTPLIGDALTFPFSLQSLTYWMLPGHVAMSVNRAFVAVATVLMLCLVLRRFLSIRATLICSLLVFLSPGHFWNQAHHHYQMSLLFFCVALYLQQGHERYGDVKLLVSLWILYALMLNSVSIQPALLMLPSLMLFLPLRDGRKAARPALLNLAAMFAAFLLLWPQLKIFFENIASSIRAEWSPYTGILSTTREQLLGLIVPPTEWMHYGINGHYSVVTYFSLAYLVFVAMGLLICIKQAKSDPVILRLVFVLGLMPSILAFLLQFHGQNIPFVRNVDSTRIWWFSNLFLVLAVGKLIDCPWSLFRRSMIVWIARICAALLGAALVLQSRLMPELDNAADLHRVIAWGTLVVLLAISFANHGAEGAEGQPVFVEGGIEVVGKKLVFGLLMLAQLPVLTRVMALDAKSCEVGNHYFNTQSQAGFQPQTLLKNMEPWHRMASNESPVRGHDLKAIQGQILGSNARAIVTSRPLSETLLKQKLITLDADYFFSPPWRTDLLSQLGIRYLLLDHEDRDLAVLKWKRIAEDQYRGKSFFLYENPEKPTLAYVVSSDSIRFIDDYQIVPNGIVINLPNLEFPGRLVVAFEFGGRWAATVDGARVTPTKSELGMMEIKVKPGDRRIEFHYWAGTLANYMLWSLASAATIILVGLLAIKSTKVMRC